jgi:hypothetical protein
MWQITAWFSDLWLEPGVAATVRDVMGHVDLGSATSEVSASVAPQDVAVMVLTPKNKTK